MVWLIIFVLSLASCSGSYWTDSGKKKGESGPQVEPRPTPGMETAASDFLGWCRDPEDRAAQRTVEAMLGIVKEQDCEIGAIELSKLKKVDLSGQGLSELGPLSSLADLEQLFLDDNQILDASPIARLDNLKHLTIGNNLLTSLDSLSTLPSLELLVASGNIIEDESPLARFPTLKTAWVGVGESVRTIRLIVDDQASLDETSDLTCGAGYRYFPFKSCRATSHPPETYKSAQTQACGIQSETSVYRSCQTAANGVDGREEKVEDHFFRGSSGFTWGVDSSDKARCQKYFDGLASSTYKVEGHVSASIAGRASDSAHSVNQVEITCSASKMFYRNDRHPDCGEARKDIIYNMCAHPSHGVESYKLLASAACGQEPGPVLVQADLSLEETQALGAIDACRSCDDLAVTDSASALIKAACISKAAAADPTPELKTVAREFASRFIHHLDDRLAGDVLRLWEL